MSIPVICPQCKKSFQVQDEHAGKRGKCPQCKSVIQVPATPPAREKKAAQPGRRPQRAQAPAPAKAAQAAAVDLPAPEKVPAGAGPASTAPAAEKEAPPAALPQEILGAFQGDIAPVRVAVMYRFGVLLVAVVMVMLPLLYVALIGLVGYLIYFHAVHATGLLGAGTGRGRIMAALLYAGPLAAGGILVLFMIKPLFARPAEQGRIRSLTRDSDPLLFAFVERVCTAVRAPKPRRIDVDCQVNAAASFRRGLLSMLGSDLVLTLGMPLAAGLSLRQFAGVLAHEFGHFSQGAGMRLTYVIRAVSYWFVRVVYERDEWDARLTHWSKNIDYRIALILYLARFFVWLTRRVLWLLMMVGHMVAGFMLRQMEFDADRYEARLAGSDTFESTARRLVVLNVANQGAHADLKNFYQEGRLGDNLPRLIEANVEQIPPHVLAEINKAVEGSTTGLLDTHPADKDRIAAARRENAPGIFRLDRPASVLFSNFDALSRNVTWDFYRDVFGPKFKPSDMHSTDDLLARQSREQEAGKALRRYFQGAFSVLRPLPLPGTLPGAPADPRQSAARLKAARQRMLDLKAGYEKAFADYDQADTHALEAEQAAAVLKADFKVRRDEYSLDLSTNVAAGRAGREAVARQAHVARGLIEFEKAAAARLVSALELLHVPQVADKIEDAQAQKRQSARILSALTAVSHHGRRLLALRNEHAALAALLGHLEGNEENQKLIRGIGEKMDAVWEHLKDLRAQLGPVPYPLDHAKGEISIGQYMLADLPPADELGAVFDAAPTAVENLLTLHARLVSRLALVGERVEKLLGLAPLPEPPEKPHTSQPTDEAPQQ